MPRPELQLKNVELVWGDRYHGNVYLGHVVDTHQHQAREHQGRGGDQEEDIEDGERSLVDDRVSHVDLTGSEAFNECFNVLLVITKAHTGHC